jgi:AbrB family looped-hinge helix DNA binding protein
MGKRARTVHISSKGQIVIPAELRRAMGLTVGGELRVRLDSPRKLVLTVPEYDEDELRAIFAKSEEWTRKTGRDLVEELHHRRRQERARKAIRHGARSR